MAVSAHFGRNGNSDDKDWVKANKKYKEEKQFIIKALFQKLRLLYSALKKEDETAQAAAEQAITDEELDIAVQAAADAYAETDEENDKQKDKDKDKGSDKEKSQSKNKDDQDTDVTTTGKPGNATAADNVDDADATGNDVDDGKQDEKEQVLDDTSDGSYVRVDVTGPPTASTGGQTTGVTANNDREIAVYDSKEPSAHRMVFISKEKLEEFENLIKDISQWTDLEKNKTYKEEYFEMKLWRLKQEQKYAEIFKLVSENDCGGDKKKSYENKLETFTKYFGKSFGYLVEQKELAKYQEFPKEYRLF